MGNKIDKGHSQPSPETILVHGGRKPEDQHGFVNTPSYRGSTVLFPTVKSLKDYDQPFTYGRHGTPTTRALEETINELEGGARTTLTASGLQAVTTTLLAFVSAGDEILMVDTVYMPTRKFCDQALTKLGVKTIYYDPNIGADIAELITDKTRLIFTESPGSLTFEIQDIPAIARVAKDKNVWLVMDNTWATPLYFKALDYGVDVSIHSATKYIVGHADALLGSITANQRAAPHIERARNVYGICPGAEETYLGARGLRSLAARLSHHQSAAIDLANWLQSRPEVSRVLHPALESHPQHQLWARDFQGSSGLFGAVLKANSDQSISTMLDRLEFFGMGYSWGGYESLVVPAEPGPHRTATTWDETGTLLRFHVGLENLDDLKSDLEAGFERLNAHEN